MRLSRTGTRPAASTKALFVVLAAWQPASAIQAAAPPSEPRAPAQDKVAVLVIGAQPDPELIAAFGIRLPDRLVRFSSDTRLDVEGPRAYLGISTPQPGILRLELILEDGRTFVRDLDEPADGVQRLISASVSNLLSGVEAGHTLPDRLEDELPEELTPVVDEPAPGGAESKKRDSDEPPSANAQVEPVDEQAPESSEPTVPDEPDEAAPSQDPPSSFSPSQQARDVAPIRRIVLGGGIEFGTTLGLSPNPGPRGMFGGGRVELAWEGGALLSVESAGGIAGNRDLRVIRWRSGLGGGWSFSRSSFELPLLALAAIEPWWVRVRGTSTEAQSTSSPKRPLLGVGLELEPRWTLRRGASDARPQWLVGFPLRLFVSGVAGSVRAAELRFSERAEAERTLGGVEVSLGVRVTLRQNRAAPPP